MLRPGEAAVDHLRFIGLKGFKDGRSDIGVLLDKLGYKLVKKPDHVVGHQYLTVDIRPRPDSDHRHPDRLGHQLSQRCGNRLQDDGKNAGRLQCPGVIDDLFGRSGVFALHLETAEGAGGLGGQSDMALDGYAGLYDRLDGRRKVSPAFQFHGVAAALFHQAARIDDGLPNGGVVAHKGHVADHQRPPAAPHDRFDVMNHVFHGDLDGSLQAHDDHTERIAHQNDVDAGFIRQQPERIIIGGHHHQLPLFRLCLPDVRDGHFFAAHRKGLLSVDGEDSDSRSNDLR